MARVSQAEISLIKKLTRFFQKTNRIVISAIKPLIYLFSVEKKDSTEDEIRAIINQFGSDDKTLKLIAKSIGVEIPNPSQLTSMSIAEQFVFIDKIMTAWLGGENVYNLFNSIARNVDKSVLSELSKSLAINLRREVPGLSALIEQWSSDNVDLVKSAITGGDISSSRRMSTIARLRKSIDVAHSNGMRVGDLAKLLEKDFGFSESRAELIARDQVLKLNGRINQHRQTSVGIGKYKWVTSKDERVRKSHKELHGKIIDWANPPNVGHPGQDIQCRCIAKPMPPNWLEVDE